ncbi:MAG: TraB/GumN family protein, partial [Pseudomonadota bacterium]
MTIDRFRIIGCLASFAMTAISACTTAPPPASAAASIPALATPPSQKPDATEAAIGAALTLAERSRGPGQVAIWSYADEDTTVYLFGTLPFFDANANWRGPAFDRALSIADKVVFEANTLSATAEAQIQR